MLTHVEARITLVIPLTNQSQPGHLAGAAGGSTLIFDGKVEDARLDIASGGDERIQMMLSSALQNHQLRLKAPERFSKFSKVAPTSPTDIEMSVEWQFVRLFFVIMLS